MKNSLFKNETNGVVDGRTSERRRLINWKKSQQRRHHQNSFQVNGDGGQLTRRTGQPPDPLMTSSHGRKGESH